MRAKIPRGGDGRSQVSLVRCPFWYAAIVSVFLRNCLGANEEMLNTELIHRTRNIRNGNDRGQLWKLKDEDEWQTVCDVSLKLKCFVFISSLPLIWFQGIICIHIQLLEDLIVRLKFRDVDGIWSVLTKQENCLRNGIQLMNLADVLNYQLSLKLSEAEYFLGKQNVLKKMWTVPLLHFRKL